MEEAGFLSFAWEKNEEKWDNILQEVTKMFAETDRSIEKRRQLVDNVVQLINNDRYAALKHVPDSFFLDPVDRMFAVLQEAKSLFPERQPAHVAGKAATIEITKKQAFAILTLSFLGRFKGYHYSDMFRERQLALCMVNYFERAVADSTEDPSFWDKKISIERRVLGQTVTAPDWEKSTKTLDFDLVVHSGKQTIEDLRDCYQVNFADPYPGGTLPSSHPDIVQEEILFLVYPELFITPLLVPRIGKEEAVIVRGVTRTNNYSGYQWSFKYAGDFTQDKKECAIIFMDALPGGIRGKDTLVRELDKAYLGFSCDTHNMPIATGNWGCGAFGGLHQQKAIIQFMAAAEAGRNLEYTTYGRSEVNGLESFFKKMKQNNITVSQLWQAIVGKHVRDLFGYVIDELIQ